MFGLINCETKQVKSVVVESADKEPTLSITIDNQQDIELFEFTNSMQALSNNIQSDFTSEVLQLFTTQTQGGKINVKELVEIINKKE